MYREKTAKQRVCVGGKGFQSIPKNEQWRGKEEGKEQEKVMDLILNSIWGNLKKEVKVIYYFISGCGWLEWVIFIYKPVTCK